MTTKKEFVEMWDKCKKEYKTVVLKDAYGSVESDFSVFQNLEDGRTFVELYISNEDSEQLISMIDIDKIERVM